MNLNISCSATISKKLAKICQDNPLFLYIQPLNNGKMVARLKISCPDDVEIDDIKKIEDINIMLEIDSVVEDVKDLGKETPIQNLYFSNQKIENNELAITDANTEIKKYKNTEKVEAQKEKVSSKSATIGKNFISDYNDLNKIISVIKDIDKPVPQVPSNRKLSRGEAIEFGKVMQSVPRLPVGVYISNETKGKLCIDDLNLVLNINEISDLSSIPAQKIKNSRQLRTSCESGLIKFRSKGEYNEWYGKQSNSEDSVDRNIGLEIFDNHEQAVEQTEEIMGNTENVPKERKTSSKPTTFTEKKNVLKKSDKDLLIKSEDDESNVNVEVTGDELTEEEKETQELIKDLPEEKEEGVDKEEPTRIPLLSDQVEKEEKNKIKRI